SNSTALHNVVQALRAGQVQGPGGSKPAFTKVVLVGHSYGSFTSLIEASRFTDVDAVVLTGYTHKVNSREPFVIESNFHPAAQDPKFADSGLDPGYITPKPGTHKMLYYDPGKDVDPMIIQRDEATKGTVTQEEIMNYLAVENTQLDINVPVLEVNGTLDGIFCNQESADMGTDCSIAAKVAEQEKSFFPQAPSVDGVMITV